MSASRVIACIAVIACARAEAPDQPVRAEHAQRGPTADTAFPPGPEGEAIRRGWALLAHTRDSLPGYVGNQLNCMNCHLDEGRRRQGSWVGVYARYPQYRPRSGTVETIEFRINDCLRRSMHGEPLPSNSREMREMVAYLAFLSRGVPVGDTTTRPVPLLASVPADSARGSAIYAAQCAVCHGQRGEGTAAAPPVWGPGSYNIGAGMARIRSAATFIRYNMPLHAPGTLSTQEAFDVATYINRQPRPDFPDKEFDWPNGDPPPDVAYPTRAARR